MIVCVNVLDFLAVKSRFSTLGSLYYDGNKDSPNPLDYFDAPSSLSKTGGYWSRTSRPAPKVATEVAPLEEIGLAHAPIVAKVCVVFDIFSTCSCRDFTVFVCGMQGPQSFPKDKRPELFKPKETEETQPEDEAAVFGLVYYCVYSNRSSILSSTLLT